MDWLARGRDYNGTADLIGRSMERDVPRCSPPTAISSVREDVTRAGICVVVNDLGVVFGAVDTRALDERPGETAEEVMRPGITTVRPSEEREKLDRRLADRNITRVVVSDPDGKLLGVYSPH